MLFCMMHPHDTHPTPTFQPALSTKRRVYFMTAVPGWVGQRGDNGAVLHDEPF